MASLSPPRSDRESLAGPCATDVARGVTRMFHAAGMTVLCEVPLPNGRRADMLAIDARGAVTIVEIKVARSDLHGDTKWPDYLDYCDRFFWALDPALDSAVLLHPPHRPERCGLIVGDRYGAEIVREAAVHALAPARRKAEMLRIARLAMRRMMVAADPELLNLYADG
jgi:hypothetical protein